MAAWKRRAVAVNILALAGLFFSVSFADPLLFGAVALLLRRGAPGERRPGLALRDG
jgi:hypothetical protein